MDLVKVKRNERKSQQTEPSNMLKMTRPDLVMVSCKYIDL